MHTVWVRLNAVVFFGLTVVVSLAVMTWMSTIGHQGFPTVDVLRVNSVKSMRSHSKKDVAVLTFDLHADLSPAFDWNIKQLFVFVVAEYASKKNPLNQVVIWDKIIEHPDDAVLHMDKATVEYGLIDQGAALRNTTVQLRLVWDHMPLTGRLFMESVPMSTYKLPGAYSTESGKSSAGFKKRSNR
mmetsp:Transcript_24684/g.55598  ORF Transcript_24684/g.55598 Transcript_24684/m.55598 type:complete len:185 (-) Transcript_24684:250-804(-)|eukprot:CAMPEP_0172614794 /NCGR_PEP_ID=MMETSP1068-20121228/55390_1 /TAXON_ID=35684 /ORGANISM="Pseudopedinella elastica, Strain CCMP716" /LENGTH=184 /DNA_ID=CAMNT_0013419717 /DNA_START=74 /DNA_END=628 /DNA_ORIENTATION=-